MLLFHVRRKPLDVFDDTAAINGLHLGELLLGALRCISAQITLPPLVRISLPAPVRRNRLDVALWVLSLNLPDLALRGTLLTPFRQNKSRTNFPPADDLNTVGAYSFASTGVSAFSFFFAEGFPGASITSMVRPSIIGACSIVLISDSNSAISFRSSSAISG